MLTNWPSKTWGSVDPSLRSLTPTPYGTVQHSCQPHSLRPSVTLSPSDPQSSSQRSRTREPLTCIMPYNHIIFSQSCFFHSTKLTMYYTLLLSKCHCSGPQIFYGFFFFSFSQFKMCGRHVSGRRVNDLEKGRDQRDTDAVGVAIPARTRARHWRNRSFHHFTWAECRTLLNLYMITCGQGISPVRLFIFTWKRSWVTADASVAVERGWGWILEWAASTEWK